MSLKSTEKYGVPVTATNKEFLTIYQTLQEVRSARGVKFAIAVVKNSTVIEAHLNGLEKMALPSEAFADLSIKAQVFIKENDEEGLKALEAEHAEVIQARKEQLAEVEVELSKTAILELKLINEELLPDDITAEQIEKLMKIIS
jgi:hypothetical protein